MTEVEIFWPAALATEDVTIAADRLQAAGIETTCRLQPVRRGGETAVLILVSTTTLQPFLAAVFERVGSDVYRSLQEFVTGLLGRGRRERPVQRTPDAVVFESSTTGDQFVFTADLPAEAYHQAIALEQQAGPGRWIWQSQRRAWLKFEDGDHNNRP